MTDLTPLIERLEKAEAGSRELDRAVYAICDKYMHAQKVTTSLDAAIALVERVLPGWRLDLTITRSESWAYLYDRDANHPRCVFIRSEDQATAPLAACIALLKALQNKESAA